MNTENPNDDLAAVEAALRRLTPRAPSPLCAARIAAKFDAANARATRAATAARIAKWVAPLFLATAACVALLLTSPAPHDIRETPAPALASNAAAPASVSAAANAPDTHAAAATSPAFRGTGGSPVSPPPTSLPPHSATATIASADSPHVADSLPAAARIASAPSPALAAAAPPPAFRGAGVSPVSPPPMLFPRRSVASTISARPAAPLVPASIAAAPSAPFATAPASRAVPAPAAPPALLAAVPVRSELRSIEPLEILRAPDGRYYQPYRLRYKNTVRVPAPHGGAPMLRTHPTEEIRYVPLDFM